MAAKKIVMAYSGGLDTSVMLKWLKDKYDAEIIAVTGDLGQNEDLTEVEEKAYKTGASKVIVKDLTDEFVHNYIFPSLKANALYEGEYPMATAIGRPLLAKSLVSVAEEEGADAISHGCTGKGNDQVRFEVGIRSLNPDLEIIAPLRTWEMRSREDEIEYALKNNIPVGVNKEKPYSIDENLWGAAVECGELEDTTNEPPADAYLMTSDPKTSPESPDKITIEFENGIPVSINGVEMDGKSIIEKLNKIGGKHGIGRMDIVENRLVGIKSREIYEAPAATILIEAHKQLEKLVLDKVTFRYKQSVSEKFSNMIYDGLWFSPLFDSLKAFIDSTQQNVTGKIDMELYKGSMRVLSRYSPYSLYDKGLATYSEDDTFDHKAAEGFIQLYGLPYETIKKVQKRNKKVYDNAVGQ